MYRFSKPMMIFALGFSLQAAHAAPSADTPSVIVRYGDLDLSGRQGATALYERITKAAQTVCNVLDGRDLAMRSGFEGCVQTAIRTAVAKVGQPALTAYAASKTNHRYATIRLAQK
jgi:UrcA family protein